MDILIAGIFILAIIVLANILQVRNRRFEKLLFDGALLILSAAVFFLGLAFFLLPSELFQNLDGAALELLDTQAYGLVLLLTSVAAIAFAIKPVRRLLAAVMPLDPSSPVHSLALVLSAYALGYTGLTLSQGGLTQMAESAIPAPLPFVIGSSLLFALIGVFGVGFIIRRRGRDLLARLGLEKPTPAQIVVAFAAIVVLVVLQACVGLIWQFMNPDQFEVLDDVSSTLLMDIDTVWEWLLLALAVGIGEELLFRGAIQPAFGLGYTSILFALIHVQYGLTPITLTVLIIAIVLGVMRRYYSTTITIIVHAGYDLTLGLLALLAAYLQQFVT